MIDVKQAVQIAKKEAANILNELSSNLEEIERETYKGRDVWSITLSLPDKLKKNPLASLGRDYIDALHYKRFLIDVETGELAAVKIREVASQ